MSSIIIFSHEVATSGHSEGLHDIQSVPNNFTREYLTYPR